MGNIILRIFSRMESQSQNFSVLQQNPINRYLTSISSSVLAGGAAYSLSGNTVSNVTKSRSTQLVCTTVTITSHQTSPGTPTTLLLSAEASRFSPVLARAATELCIKSMICLLRKVSTSLSLSRRWSTFPRFTQVIKSIALITSRNGTSVSAELMIESGHPT